MKDLPGWVEEKVLFDDAVKGIVLLWQVKAVLEGQLTLLLFPHIYSSEVKEVLLQGLYYNEEKMFKSCSIVNIK